MADKKVHQNQVSDHTLVWGTGIFFGILVLNKFFKWFSSWIVAPEHQILLVGSVIAGLTPLFYWAAKKREAVIARREKEEAIIGPGEGAVFCGVTDKSE